MARPVRELIRLMTINKVTRIRMIPMRKVESLGVPELLRSLNDYRMLIYAVVLIATMIFTSSQGGQEIQERIKAFFKRGKKAEEVK